MAMGLDSLYGNLLAGPPNRPPQDSPEPEDLDEEKPSKKGSGDDMFSAPPPKAGASPGNSPPSSDADKKDEPAKPAFSASKLMMPPVRKKMEPVPGKKPIPSLDIAKLQEEKEALMRQRAAAAVSDKSPAAATGSGGATSTSFVRPASAGTDDAVATSGATATSTSASTSLYGNPDEEYDPAKPNDYDEFCRRRMRLKAEEELEKRRNEALARHQKTQAPVEPKEDDFATKMLKKMGWKEGSGLGKEGQGMSTPLILKKTDNRQGVMAEGQKREAPTPQPQAQPEAKVAKAVNRPPSNIILLNNLVGAGEVDEDLEEETADEAAKYGKVKKCLIKEIKGLPDDQAVRIFLEFETIESATKALVDMNGRYFGGRVVKARFFDVARFAEGDLDKRPDE